jgi:hypothetical protein
MAIIDIIHRIDWTTVVASAITASIIGSSQFIFIRYLARVLDRIEREMAKADKKKNGADRKEQQEP